jgi:predicted nucleic acid-binding Zn ribbon protein
VGIIFKGDGFYVTDNRGDTSSLMPKRDKDEKTEDASSNGDGKGEETESA